MFLRNWARLYTNRTKPEILLEREIALLGKPYRAQHPFFGMRIIADFALLDERIIIEVDGASHSLPAQRYKDMTRTIALEKIGWKCVRVTNEEVLESPSDALKMAMSRVTHRLSIQELEEALQALPPDPVPLRAKRSKRKPTPAPR